MSGVVTGTERNFEIEVREVEVWDGVLKDELIGHFWVKEVLKICF